MPDLFRFHARIYARPHALTEQAVGAICGVDVRPLIANQVDLLSGWPITFDEGAQSLQRLSRLHFEPDGSFVWAMPGRHEWQLCGSLFDRGPRLAYVELQGVCDGPSLDQFLKSLGWPATPLVFELIPDGVLLSETDFRLVALRIATSDDPHDGTG